MSCCDEMSQKIRAVLAKEHFNIPERPLLLFPTLSSSVRSLSLSLSLLSQFLNENIPVNQSVAGVKPQR